MLYTILQKVITEITQPNGSVVIDESITVYFDEGRYIVKELIVII